MSVLFKINHFTKQFFSVAALTGPLSVIIRAYSQQASPSSDIFIAVHVLSQAVLRPPRTPFSGGALP